MSIPGAGSPLFLSAAAAEAAAAHQVDRSLRFNSGDTSNLSKTFSSAGNRKTWTWSCWYKRTVLGTKNQKFFSIVHQAGNGNQNEVCESYRRLKVKAVVRPFFESIVEQYQWADLVISRSGAGIISELTAVGVASVLVPLPTAIDDHQKRNASFLEKSSAAKIIEQNTLFETKLISFLCSINREKLKNMAIKAKELARFNSAKIISDEVIKVLNAK